MFGKAFKGELGLAATFWKFGFIGIVIFGALVSFFAKMLNGYLQGRSVYNFFMHNFHFVYSDKMSIFWVLCYYSAALWMVFYTLYIVKGVWISAGTYEKSRWLAFFARLFISLLAAFYLYTFPVIKLF